MAGANIVLYLEQWQNMMASLVAGIRKSRLLFVFAAGAAAVYGQEFGLRPLADGAGPGIHSSAMPSNLTPFFVIVPTIITSTGRVLQEGRAPLGIHCYNLFTGAPLVGCNITLQVKRTAYSGGHAHNNPPGPDGFLTQPGATTSGATRTISGVSDQNGNFYFDFVASQVSGVVGLQSSGTYQGSPLNGLYFEGGIEISGLSSFSTSGFGYQFDRTTNHEFNHTYATRDLIQKTLNAVAVFQLIGPFLDPPVQNMPAIHFTGGASLPKGGLLDISGNWSPPHRSHRKGGAIDIGIRGLDDQFLKVLKAAIMVSFGCNTEVACFPVPTEQPSYRRATHWHAVIGPGY